MLQYYVQCIMKIMANWLKAILSNLNGKSQAAFIGGWYIGDNILLCQELLHNYHKDKREKKCAIKVDLLKAYDFLDYKFLLVILKIMGFPPKYVMWVEECISITSFSISVNKELVGFFGSSRELRQGHPISPYLFVIAMEDLSYSLAKLWNNKNFGHHWRCKVNNITHLCFVDYLILICKVDKDLVGLIKATLDVFHTSYGLQANPSKSNMYFSEISQ